MERYSHKRVLIGIAILLVGAALLLSNLGIMRFELQTYILRWEVLLITLGAIFIISHDNKVPGFIMVVIGGVFYIRDFYELSFNFWQVFWPSMLILAGAIIILKHKVGIPHCQKKTLNGEDFIDEVAVFGGGSRTIVTENFMGGKILAIFGGSDFNLLRSKLAPGKNYIEVLAIFGGMKLIVPQEWKIKIEVVSIFGGFSDKHRLRPKEAEDGNQDELIIKGVVIFGGGEIKSY